MQVQVVPWVVLRQHSPWLPATQEELPAADLAAYDQLPPETRQFIRNLPCVTPDAALFALWQLSRGVGEVRVHAAIVEAARRVHSQMVQASWDPRVVAAQRGACHAADTRPRHGRGRRRPAARRPAA